AAGGGGEGGGGNQAGGNKTICRIGGGKIVEVGPLRKDLDRLVVGGECHGDDTRRLCEGGWRKAVFPTFEGEPIAERCSLVRAAVLLFGCAIAAPASERGFADDGRPEHERVSNQRVKISEYRETGRVHFAQYSKDRS